MLKIALPLALLIAPAVSQASPVDTALSGAELRGAATFRWVGLPIYEARLYTKSGARLDWGKDFGLELKYLRNLTKFDLVEGTMRELERTGTALPLRAQLERCFDNVRKGDRYVAVSDGQDKLRFWRNGRRMCTLAYPQIKTRFMAIFLGDDTRSKSFTRRLRGE
ncbi:hypothetical protein N4R57_02845 [Rhodobacteraceae bacterium D3-12]|nr:hypothetical protein N4R57_02845 [Rhodobacteraceae bacterium D3-12]